jgi:nucleotide-binding universal stress UspA family protein
LEDSGMKKILVCTDGSGYSSVSCEFAARLAMRDKAAVDIMYVTDLRQYEMPIVADISGSLGAQPYLNLISQLQQVEKIRIDAIEQSSRRVFEQAGYNGQLSFLHYEGTLVDRVDDIQNDYDLIVIGKRGTNSEAAKEHLGSSLERVVRVCNKPVLVTSRAFRPFKNILFAYDAGVSSKRALDFLATDPMFEGMKITVTSVEEKGRMPAAQMLDEAVGKLLAGGRDCERKILTGDVESAISTLADPTKVDMLVIGAFGHNRIREFFIGSTTTELLRTKNMPLLCFR